MKDSRKFFAWVLVVLMTFALLAGGCGGSSSSSSGSSDTADDDGSGRNDSGFEDVSFIRLSGEWAFSASSVKQYGRRAVDIDPFSISPSANFRIKAYGDGTLLLADQDAGENPTVLRVTPIIGTPKSPVDDAPESLDLVAPAVYTYVSKNVYEATYETKNAISITDKDTYRIEIADPSTYKTVKVTHIHYEKDFYSGTFKEVYEVNSELVSHQLDYMDEDDYTGRNANGFEDITFTGLSGVWQAFSGSMYCYMVNNSTTSTRDGALYKSFKPSERFRIKTYADGTLVLAAEEEGENPRHISFEPITAQFKDALTGSATVDISILLPGVYTLTSTKNGSSYYEAQGYDGDTYQLEVTSSYQPRYIRFTHWHKDNNGTNLSDYYTYCQLTNVSFD